MLRFAWFVMVVITVTGPWSPGVGSLVPLVIWAVFEIVPPAASFECTCTTRWITTLHPAGIVWVPVSVLLLPWYVSGRKFAHPAPVGSVIVGGSFVFDVDGRVSVSETFWASLGPV